jgi:type VI secretion system protein ImpH
MSSQSWRKNSPLVDLVQESPGDFDFIQIVRILERALIYHNHSGAINAPRANVNFVGNYSPPNRESLRFLSSSALSFPENEVVRTRQQKTDDNQIYWEVLVNFIGLTGSMGVLPYHYTEIILQRLKNRDNALQSFLNLFNHRITSLFYKVSTRYKLALQYESTRLQKKLNLRATREDQFTDTHTKILMSLAGLGTHKLHKRQSVNDETIVYYSGYFTQSLRTAYGLKQIISDYFKIPADIQEFVGQWQDLIDDVRTRLSWSEQPEGQNASLGRSCMLGKRGWYVQAKVQICLGPLTRSQYNSFAPGTKNLRVLKELTRLYLGMEKEFDIIIRIKRSEILQQPLNRNTPPVMGWSTWLGEKDAALHAQELVQIKLSSASLN